MSPSVLERPNEQQLLLLLHLLLTLGQGFGLKDKYAFP